MFPKDIKFKYEWRPYQIRVLDEIKTHMHDDHLHIVAAPGSGKTVLGLEVMLRLDKSTLVLSPTLTIRNQWVERFCELFLQVKGKPEWISTNVKSPGIFTSSTYQGVHAAFKSFKKQEIDFADVLKKAGIKTLILDEAHHLRTEWWNALFYLKSNIEGLKIVALTATPPYDSTTAEWEKYQKLCSTIDAEISVPELVAEKNLCPHQDLIYFNQLSESETAIVKNFKDASKQFVKNLKNNSEFIVALDTHPFVLNPESFESDILNNPEYFSSIVIFLKNVGKPIPTGLVKVLGTNRLRVPKLNREWLEVLLNNFLYKETDVINEQLKDLIKKDLQQFGAIHKGKVSLIENLQVKKLLKSSIKKLESITDIIKIESESLKDNLRLVVLTDFITKEYLGDSIKVPKLNKIGVVTIFESIRRTLKYKDLGIISGKIVIIPTAAKNTFVNVALEHGLEQINVVFKELAHDPEFTIVSLTGKGQSYIVSIITKLFTRGDIKVLVGTKSLLGEGWDAPVINTLVLASFVGSFMLSNQMRGRAIRINPGEPNKVGNVWHLATLYDDGGYLGEDYSLLERRFKVFVGPDRAGRTIGNGLARLSVIPEGKNKADRLQIQTAVFVEDAKNRAQCRYKWENALLAGVNKMIQPELKTEPELRLRGFVFNDAIMALLVQGGTVIGGMTLQGTEMLNKSTINSTNISTSIFVVSFFFILGFLMALPKFLKAMWILLKHGTIDSSLAQVSRALVNTMCYAGVIKTDPIEIRINVTKELDGKISCGIYGGSIYEKALFTEALSDLLGTIKNPRYILIRKSYLGFLKRSDYHPIPACLDNNKKNAEFFLNEWHRLVGNADLIYTRTTEGRRLLIKGRFESMAGKYDKKLSRVERWR